MRVLSAFSLDALHCAFLFVLGGDERIYHYAIGAMNDQRGVFLLHMKVEQSKNVWISTVNLSVVVLISDNQYKGDSSRLRVRGSYREI